MRNTYCYSKYKCLKSFHFILNALSHSKQNYYYVGRCLLLCSKYDTVIKTFLFSPSVLLVLYYTHVID